MENILVVDDEAEIWKICERTLERKGHMVHSASNSDAALALFNNVVFDIALVDLRMPGNVDGMELLRLIKEYHPKTQVIIVTADESIETAIQSIKYGAFDYILKPFNLKELVSSVENVLNYTKYKNEDNIFKTTDYLYNLFSKVNKPKEALLGFILDEAATALGADSGSIHLYIPERKTLKLKAAFGMKLDTNIETPLGERVLGWAAKNQSPLLLNNRFDDKPQFRDLTVRSNIASSMVVPLIKHDTLLGVICLNRFVHKTNKKFTEFDLESLKLFAIHSALIIALDHFSFLPHS